MEPVVNLKGCPAGQNLDRLAGFPVISLKDLDEKLVAIRLEWGIGADLSPVIVRNLRTG